VSVVLDPDDGGDDLEVVHAAGVTGGRTLPRPDRRAGRWGLFLGLALAVAVIDQLTKAWLVANVDPGGAIEVVGDWLRLIHGRNDGGLFGMFEGSAEIFAIGSIAVIALIVGYHARSRPNVVLSTALGLLLGGAIGNLIDRLQYGYVVDFVDAGIGDLRFYTFNIADSAITGSILLLIGLALFPGLGGSPDQGSEGPDA
jgi:signal peptidase II